MTTPAPVLSSAEVPFVSLVLPVKNEAHHLARAFDAIDAQTFPRDRIEIIVVDGGSSDDTVDVVMERARLDNRIRLLGGGGVNTPLAMNIGIEGANGSLIGKIDGHGFVNPTFVADAAAILAVQPEVGCVGGLIAPIADSETERSIAYARFSVLGVGAGVYTAADRLEETDTVQCGIYRKVALNEVTGFDALLAYGEDEELNYRVRLAGWKIIRQPTMIFSYHVRPTYRALFRQYFRYGRARVAVIRKHRGFFRAKHAVPALVVATLAIGGAASTSQQTRPLGVIVWAGYLGTVIVGGALVAVRNRFHRPELVAFAISAIHIGYGIGTLVGLTDLVRDRKRGESDQSPDVT